MDEKELVSAIGSWLRSDIDGRGTPYRHCKGCDDPTKPHTCRLCQRCLAADHTHDTCEQPVKRK